MAFVPLSLGVSTLSLSALVGIPSMVSRLPCPGLPFSRGGLSAGKTLSSNPDLTRESWIGVFRTETLDWCPTFHFHLSLIH
jgi:hypothetical protein